MHIVILLQEICAHLLQSLQETALCLIATVLWHMAHAHRPFIQLFVERGFENFKSVPSWNINRTINVIMINVMIMIIMVRTRIGIRILKIMKIEIVLIRLILLRRSSSNKVKKILGRTFISKGLFLTCFFIRRGLPKWIFLIICCDKKPYT